MKKIHPANNSFHPPLKPWLRIAVPLILLQLVIFKWIYPYPGFFSDSYTYIQAAMDGQLVSIRQIGYSWFLLLIHNIYHSATFLVAVQYLLLQVAGLYLFFSLLSFFRPSRWVAYLLFFFLLLNPASLYICNEVSSDALFTALSLFWITGLLWLVQKPGWYRLVRQLILLIIIFFVRYNALYYPFVAAIAFLLSRKRGLFRWTGIVSGFLVIAVSILLVTAWTKKETGVRIFSGFSGWQIANNALCIYPHISIDTADLPSPECRELNGIVAAFFAAPPPAFRPVDPSAPLAVSPGSVDTWFMWETPSPLKIYLRLRQQREHTDYFTEWNRTAVVFSQYGAYLVKHHPLLFARYYLLPSAATFFYPNPEILGRYNEGKKEMEPVARDWFHYPSLRVDAHDPSVQSRIISSVSCIYLLINLAAFITFILFLLSGRLRTFMLSRLHDLPRCFFLAVAFLILNAGFSILATGSILRYQLAPLSLLFCIIVLFFSRLAVSHQRWNP